MPTIEDPEESAERAGLAYVDTDGPGLTRVRRGRGFSYRTPSGRTLRSKRVRRRIERLAIPPAWTDVWISPRPSGHIQATGRDDRGRLQYRYHDRWTEVRQTEKFTQLGAFGRQLPTIRARVASDLRDEGRPRRRVLALVIALLEDTLIRIGNRRYTTDDSYGLTTLLPRHVRPVDEGLVLDFTGKGGIEHSTLLTDPELVAAVVACDEMGGQQLFTYRDEAGIEEIRSDDVNERLREIAGEGISARDFRTWGGTVAVVGELGPLDPDELGSERATRHRFLEAVDVAADLLGNTRVVCRDSYVHPAVEPAFRSGALHLLWLRSRRSEHHTRAERTTLRILEESRHLGTDVSR